MNQCANRTIPARHVAPLHIVCHAAFSTPRVQPRRAACVQAIGHDQNNVHTCKMSHVWLFFSYGNTSATNMPSQNNYRKVPRSSHDANTAAAVSCPTCISTGCLVCVRFCFLGPRSHQQQSMQPIPISVASIQTCVLAAWYEQCISAPCIQLQSTGTPQRYILSDNVGCHLPLAIRDL
jgi:hypothetical protein